MINHNLFKSANHVYFLSSEIFMCSTQPPTTTRVIYFCFISRGDYFNGCNCCGNKSQENIIFYNYPTSVYSTLFLAIQYLLNKYLMNSATKCHQSEMVLTKIIKHRGSMSMWDTYQLRKTQGLRVCSCCEYTVLCSGNFTSWWQMTSICVLSAQQDLLYLYSIWVCL